ncbi:MAG: sugar phosphorylase, partial [Anaerolineae bacterium]|nr:sugar phosphorylase [Anaerolineae bacterium]
MTEKIRAYLRQLYPPQQADETYHALITRLINTRKIRSPRKTQYSEADVLLITYGDSLNHPQQAPLQTLRRFALDNLKPLFSGIHILPFYPYSSDDGFSVIDFYAVNPALGKWDDVVALGADFDLMFDAVFNHMSAKSDWFKQFLADDPEYAGLFMTESPNTDLSMVTRPRTSPLLTPFTKPNGETIHLWTTFSADQIDFDPRTPNTVLRLIDVLLFYISEGATYIRLDAIAFLWKQVGTTSLHLPQTHIIIQLMRAVLDEIAPHVVIITETNVPHAENISYWGDGTNEAQMVYNFTLPPLLFYSLTVGDTAKLRDWINTLQTPSDKTTFFNFTASHDGIGVRPVEGMLSPDEVDMLADVVTQRGGRVSYRTKPDGSQSPYELNITYVDAIRNPDHPHHLQVQKFILSQAVMLTLAGVPAVYIHSLLGSVNDVAGMKRLGHNRAINRAKLDVTQLEAELATPNTPRHDIFNAYQHLLTTRRTIPDFHPNASQIALDTG